MSRFPRLRRRPDHWSDAHERARTRLAERLDGPLGLSESTWLDEHLAGCADCAAIGAAYDEDRLALLALREDPPEPPRDLWARTSAAIEAEGPRDRTSEGNVRRSLPIGALSGLAVVAIMLGVGLVTANLPLGPVGGVKGEESPLPGDGGPVATTPSARPVAEATPIIVDPGDVGYLDNARPGDLYRISVDEVCPADNSAGCPSLREGDRLALAVPAAKAIVGSPSRQNAIAISATAGGGDELVVVDLPSSSQTPAPTPTETASAAPSPSARSASPSPSASASVPPDASESPPAASPSSEPTVPPIEPSATPTATAAQRLAIASGIEVVGESAAFSADGAWFAFTARPAGAAGGADVYAWRVGTERAAAVTHDGTSYFGSWQGNELVVSRPDDTADRAAEPVTVRVDPATGDEHAAGAAWRPAVDPTGQRAIVWIGSVTLADDGATWLPGEGTLELRRWSDDGAGEASGAERDRLVTDEAAREFDVRWDETGEWVAVWVADRDDPVVGRLTLYHVDADEDRLERIGGAPVDVPALPGFSIGDGRLAWATPRGQGGEGSRIQIAAWSQTDVGIVESSPGEDPVVIR